MNKWLYSLILLTMMNTVTLAASSDQGFYGFVGADFGLGIAGKDADNTTSRDGIHAQFKGVFSYYQDTHLFDLGLGGFYNEMSNEQKTTTTKSIFLEGSARYRFNKLWNLGPVIMAPLGNDNTFSSQIKKDSSEFFAGLRLEYEPQVFRTNKVRLNATILRDVTISERSVTFFTVGLQFGFPFSDTRVKEVKKVKVIKKIIYERRKPKIIKISKTRLKATFDRGAGFYFKSGSDNANEQMVSYLKRLAFFLNKYKTEWRTVVVSGHTDDVGKLKYNMNLSKRRANTVKSLLAANGVDRKRIKVRWYGPNKPVDKRKTKEARAKNRRVEIEFQGVKNVQSFHEGLSVIQ